MLESISEMYQITQEMWVRNFSSRTVVVIYAKLVLEGISNVTSISSSVYHFIFEINIRIRHYLSAPLFQKFFITSLDGKMPSQIIHQNSSTLLVVSSSRIQTSI